MKSHPQYSKKQLSYFIRLARSELNILFGRESVVSKRYLKLQTNGLVNVTIRRNGLLCGSMGVRSQYLVDAIRFAVRKVAGDIRFNRRIVAGDLDMLTIELWFQMHSATIKYEDIADFIRTINLGQDGIQISLGDLSAYYKPSVPITSAIKTPLVLVEKLCKKAGLSVDALENPHIKIERSSWINIYEIAGHEDGYVILNKLRHYSHKAVNRKRLSVALKASVLRMLAIQRNDGSLGYQYDPFRDKWEPRFSQVRQAGCAYALARAADHYNGQNDVSIIKSAAERSVHYLMTHIGESSNWLFIKDDHVNGLVGKLGTTALTALALQYSSGKLWKNERNALINQLLDAQNADGSFKCLIGPGSTVNEIDNKQNYFPGEALLALTQCAHRTGDMRIYKAILKSFEFYSHHFRNCPTSAFVVWQADVWSKIAMKCVSNVFPHPCIKGELQKISQFVFEQVDWLLSHQYNESLNGAQEYRGGFKRPNPPTCSTSGYVEAIVCACNLAEKLKDAKRVTKYRKAAILAFEFLLRLQVQPETVGLFPQPKLAVGGITKSLELFEMRCDNDQHFVTACMTALECDSLWNR